MDVKHNMKLFKIRNKISGLYSSGGSRPSWTKQGKTWTHPSHVNRHMQEQQKRDAKPRGPLIDRSITDDVEINFYKNGEVVVFEAREAGTGQIEDYTWDGKYGTAPVVPEEPEAQAAEETSVTVSEYKWSNHPLIRGYIDDGILVPLDTGKFLVGSPAYRAVNLRPPNVKNQPKVLIGSIEMFGNMVQGYVKRFQVVGSVDEVARVVSEMERIFNGIPSLKVEEVDES